MNTVAPLATDPPHAYFISDTVTHLIREENDIMPISLLWCYSFYIKFKRTRNKEHK